MGSISTRETCHLFIDFELEKCGNVVDEGENDHGDDESPARISSPNKREKKNNDILLALGSLEVVLFLNFVLLLYFLSSLNFYLVPFPS